MKLEEAIARLNKFADIETSYGKHVLITTSQYHDIKEAINTVLQHTKHLQKENEKLQTEVNSLEKHLKDAQKGWTTLYIKGVFDKNEHWRNKTREKIKEINDKRLEVNGWESEFDYAVDVLQDLLKEE